MRNPLARLVSIQVGRPRWNVTADGQRWRSAFFKAPVSGPVALGFTNLDGDGQASRRIVAALRNFFGIPVDGQE